MATNPHNATLTSINMGLELNSRILDCSSKWVQPLSAITSDYSGLRQAWHPAADDIVHFFVQVIPPQNDNLSRFVDLRVCWTHTDQLEGAQGQVNEIHTELVGWLLACSAGADPSAPFHTDETKTKVSFQWFGGALFYAQANIDGFVNQISQSHPWVPAKEREWNLSLHLDALNSTKSSDQPTPKRMRVQI